MYPNVLRQKFLEKGKELNLKMLKEKISASQVITKSIIIESIIEIHFDDNDCLGKC